MVRNPAITLSDVPIRLGTKVLLGSGRLTLVEESTGASLSELRVDALYTVAVGDRVAVNPARYCGRCRFCGMGRPNLCENVFFMGSASRTPHMQGGFASLFEATPAQCVKVSDRTPLPAAALAEEGGLGDFAPTPEPVPADPFAR